MKKVFFGIFAVALCFSSYASVDINTIRNNKTINFSFTSKNNEKASGDINEFLNSYYGKSFQTGKSADVTIDDAQYTVTEVIIEGSNVVNGYTIVNKRDNIFLYFMDVDRVNSSITAIDITQNETVKLKNMEKAENINFDFLATLNSSNGSSANLAGRFWGWQCGKKYSIEPGSCYRTCTYYVLYQAWTPSTDSYDCDHLPGSNPKVLN